jgi:hypothetical protein
MLAPYPEAAPGIEAGYGGLIAVSNKIAARATPPPPPAPGPRPERGAATVERVRERARSADRLLRPAMYVCGCRQVTSLRAGRTRDFCGTCGGVVTLHSHDSSGRRRMRPPNDPIVR